MNVQFFWWDMWGISQFLDADWDYTKFDDSYSTLAYRFYDDVSLWWIIARANEGFKGNLRLPVGTKLNIPTEIGDILSELERLNNKVE